MPTKLVSKTGVLASRVSVSSLPGLLAGRVLPSFVFSKRPLWSSATRREGAAGGKDLHHASSLPYQDGSVMTGVIMATTKSGLQEGSVGVQQCGPDGVPPLVLPHQAAPCQDRAVRPCSIHARPGFLSSEVPNVVFRYMAKVGRKPLACGTASLRCKALGSAGQSGWSRKVGQVPICPNEDGPSLPLP